MTAPQSDLFDRPVLPGTVHARGACSAGPGARADRRDRRGRSRAFPLQGWLGKRLTAPFGWRHDFEDAGLRSGRAIPDVLMPPRERAAFAGPPPADLVQALTGYDPGAGIGWHRDRPVFEHVVGISLGVPARMRFGRRRRDGGLDRASALLAPRPCCHLGDEVRPLWEHSIATMGVTRCSITFRSLSDRLVR